MSIPISTDQLQNEWELALDLLIARAVRKVRKAHGSWMARDPNTRELIVELVQSGIDQEDDLVELVEIDHLHRRAEFAIMISPAHQGRGYARPATSLAIAYAFRVLNLYKLFLLVDVDNAAAAKAGLVISSRLLRLARSVR